jgi:tetratricopeptide (TPR) repeat protein
VNDLPQRKKAFHQGGILSLKSENNKRIIMGIFSSIFGGSKTPEENKEKNFDILKYDGIRAMNIGKLTYALKCLEEATAIREDLETMQHMANIHLRLNHMDEARSIVTRMTELAPEEAAIHLSLANICYMQEDYAAMNEACQQALKLDDKNHAAYFLAAKAAVGMKNGLHAIAMLTRAIMINEEFTEAYLLRAQILMNFRQTKEAEEDIDKLLELNPEEENALLLKAEILTLQKKDEEAIEMIEQVIALNPFCENAYLMKGNYYLQKDNEKAMATFNEAIEMNPNSAQAYHARGCAKMVTGDSKGSAEDLKRAIELAPQIGAAISGEYHNYEQQQQNIPF